jgi:hypothetical protein
MSDLPPTNRQTLVLRLFDGEEMGLCRQALLVGLVAGHMLKHSFWQKEGSRMPFELRSSRFRENGAIAKKYTCDGPDVSVPLNWTDPPDGTKSFALVVDDPDAPSGTFVHWVLYDLPGDARQLAENIPPKRVLDNGAKQGVNDFHKIGYGGPCPPRGPAHRYSSRFTP